MQRLLTTIIRLLLWPFRAYRHNSTEAHIKMQKRYEQAAKRYKRTKENHPQQQKAEENHPQQRYIIERKRVPIYYVSRTNWTSELSQAELFHTTKKAKTAIELLPDMPGWSIDSVIIRIIHLIPKQNYLMED